METFCFDANHVRNNSFTRKGIVTFERMSAAEWRAEMAHWNRPEDAQRCDYMKKVAALLDTLTERAMRRRRLSQDRRAALRDAMDSIGMVRVRGNLGGIYYE